MDTKIPVIFVHGYASSATEWVFQMITLEKMGIQAIAVDLLGHGEGTRSTESSDYNIDNLYEDFVSRFMACNFTGPVVLVGHSLGAYISLKFSAQYPEMVKKLILLAPFTRRDQLLPATLNLVMNHPLIGSFFLGITPLWLIRYFISVDKVNSSGLPGEIIDNLALDYKRADSRIVYIGNSVTDISSLFKDIIQPTLVIWGDKDNTLQQKHFFELINQLPNIHEYRVLEGGHIFQLTHSKEVGDVILSFLSTDNKLD